MFFRLERFPFPIRPGRYWWTRPFLWNWFFYAILSVNEWTTLTKGYARENALSRCRRSSTSNVAFTMNLSDNAATLWGSDQTSRPLLCSFFTWTLGFQDHGLPYEVRRMAGSGDQEIGMITERLRKSTSWWSSPFIRKRAIAPHLFYTGQCNLPLSFELLQSKETAY